MVLTNRGRIPRAGRLGLAIALASALAAAGCGERGAGGEKASQTAARVNKDEITVHQINFVLQQQRNLRPEQADAAGRQVLERLIDQQLALQKADELKLDRDPRVVQQLEAARREIIARAYLDKLGESAQRPTPEEIRRYYEEKPALFAQRRVYNLQEVLVEATPEQVAVLRRQLESNPPVTEFVEQLRAAGMRFAGNTAVRGAEQLPLSSVDAFAKLQPGQALVQPTPTGLQVVYVADVRTQPVTEEQARPAIEQFILNDRKRKRVEDDLKAMRADARIEYLGPFAAAAAPPAPPAEPAPAASGGLDAADIGKGLGIK